MERQRIDFYKKWNGKRLEDDGVTVSRQYRGFQTAFKNILEGIAKDLGARLVWFSKGHYDETAMFERGGRFAYLSHSNNIYGRSTPSFNSILVRTASHEKDYTGGPNNFVRWIYLTNEIDRLLGGRGDVEDLDLYPDNMLFEN